MVSIMENWRDRIPYKSYNKFGNIVLSLFFLSAVTLSGITINLHEKASFHCDPDKSVAGDLSKKTFIEASCSFKYEQKHNSPIPLRGFVLLNVGLILVVCIIYAFRVNTRIKRYDTPASTSNDVERQPLQQSSQPNQKAQARTYFSVFNIYITHLLLRIVLAIVFTVFMFHADFPTKFLCPWPSSNSDITVSSNGFNGTTIPCRSSVGLERTNSSVAVGVANIALAFIALVEILYLLRQIRLDKDFSSDLEFCCVYLLGKRKTILKVLKEYKNRLNMCGVFEMETSFGKKSKKKLKEMYVKLIIREGRVCEMPEFAEVGRHEIYRTHLKSANISIKEIEDMFLSRGSDGKLPHKILVVGRPGIGKSVLTRKILLHWTEELHEFYGGKLAILLKFRTFEFEENRCCSLKDMLKLGVGLPVDKLDTVYEYVLANPERVLLIFDGLDELHIDSNCLTEDDDIPDDYNKTMPVFSLFRKLVSGRFLAGATVITTTRPTADRLYSKLENFDQTYEILGFTEERIQDRVMKFCDQNNGIGTRVWSYIQENAELLSLCYIPVSCLIVCLTLVECIKAEDCKVRQSSVNEGLPRTLTELYKRAIRVILWNHHPACRSQMKVTDYLYSDDKFPEDVKSTLERLGKVAYTGIKQRKLTFDLDTNEENCGLLNSLPNECKPLYCFLHLTIQEYLAAKELVDETSSPGDVEEFLTEYIGDGNWHLVIQFYAGLLRDKFTEKRLLVEICKSFIDWIPPIAMWQERKERTLLMIKCLHELQDDDIMKQAAAKLDGGEEQVCSLRGMGIAPVDCPALFYLLIYVRNLVYLDLSSNNLADGGCLMELAKFLEHKWSETDDKLTGLNLSYTKITQTRVQHLARVLTSENCKLTNLNLLENFIGDEGVKHLSDVLKNENCKLTDLNLESNDIGDDGVKHLCDALKVKNCKLTNLNLGRNAIENGCVKHLSDALKSENCKLTNLNLERNAIEDEGVKHLCDALKDESCKLTSLNLERTKIGCVKHLSGALQNENCKLTNLNLGSNDVGYKGVKHLSDALENENCKLANLNLERNAIGYNGVKHLSDALKNENCKLTNLNLGRNGIGAVGAKHLSDVLKNENCKLTNLNLGRNAIENRGVKDLSDALKHENCKLTNLNLGSNGIGAKGAKHLSDALGNENCKLTNLNLENNGIGAEGAKHLSDALKSENCKRTNLNIESDAMHRS